MRSFKYHNRRCVQQMIAFLLFAVFLFGINQRLDHVRTASLLKPRARMNVLVEVSSLLRHNHEPDLENDTSSTARQAYCQPADSVAFVKTFKTASSTVNSILSRYGYTRNLSIALPKQEMFLSFEPFHPDNGLLLEKPTPPGFHILNNHAIYNRTGFREIMRPEAKYITLLRDPVKQFYSFILYFQALSTFGMTGDILSPDFPLQDLFDAISATDRFRSKCLHNGQLFVLGLDPAKSSTDPAALSKKILELDEEMDLVLINEYLDESLLLLRKMMCWTYEDILYIPKLISNRKYVFPDKHMTLVRQWTFADGLLYHHFNETLWRKLRDYGPQLSEDLEYYRALRGNVEKICASEPMKIDSGIQPLPNLAMDRSWENLCANLLRDEVPYIDLRRNEILARRNGTSG